MKKVLFVALALLVFIVMATPVIAVGPGKKIEFESTGGKVVFDGTAHSKAKCNECHTAIFKMKKGADKMTMKDMEAGKYCGACHNGTKAFSVKDCAKCHKK